MSEIDRQLPRGLRSRRRRRTLVVLADSQQEVARLQIDRSPWQKSRVVPVVGLSTADLHARLAQLSAIALVVDARRSSGSAQLRALEENFFHLIPRGAWVALRSTRRIHRRERVVRVARKLREARSRLDVEQRWREHVRALADVKVVPGMVVIAKGNKRHRLMLREAQAPALLATREPQLHVTEITRLDAGRIDTAGLIHDHGAVPVLRVPEVISYPEHCVWRYDGLVRLPRGPLAYHRRALLPDSFRWHLAPELRVRGVPHAGEHFARLKDDRPSETLPGSYFNLLYGHPGHFGHLMTEALAKLWGWWPAKEQDPSLKLLCRNRPSTGKPGPEATLLPAFGIPPEDTVWVDGGVMVEHLVGATPMWHNAPPFYAHPGIRNTWERLRSGLLDGASVDAPARIFVTRQGGNRPCRNVDEVERFFADRGFAVVSPETLSIPEQVGTFAGAHVIAGFGGAGMFNLLYAQSVETVIVLNQSAYQARNEHLIAAVLGAQIHTFWSPPEVDHPPGETSYAAHQSGWSFDFDLNGRELARLLERHQSGLVE